MLYAGCVWFKENIHQPSIRGCVWFKENIHRPSIHPSWLCNRLSVVVLQGLGVFPAKNIFWREKVIIAIVCLLRLLRLDN